MANGKVGRPLKLPGLYQIQWILENKVGEEEINKLQQNQERLINMQGQDSEGRIYKINCIDYMHRAISKFHCRDEHWIGLMTAFLFSNASFRKKLYEMMEITLTNEDYYFMCGDEEDLINIYLLDKENLKQVFSYDEYFKNIPIYGKRAKPEYKVDLFLINNTDKVIHMIEVKIHPIRNGDLRQMSKYIGGLNNGKTVDIPKAMRFKDYKIHIAMVGVGKPKKVNKDLLNEADIYFIDEGGKMNEYQW